MTRPVTLLLGLLLPVGLAAQAAPDTTGPHLVATFGMRPLAVRPTPEFRLAQLLSHPDSAARVRAWDIATRQALDSARAERDRIRTMLAVFRFAGAPGADTSSFLGLDRRYASLIIDGQARVELRTERNRNERCTPYELLDPSSGCRGTFTAPRIDDELTMRAGGVIGQRMHVDVDYDSHRDFTANNNIRVYYQGLSDEILQRVDFGTVTFTPPPSRFITASIPANSFGVSAQFQVGDLHLQALVASQKGSVVAERHYTIGGTTSQPQNRQERDLDFDPGRFIWVVDPALFPGYPGLDILNLDPSALTPDQRPTQVRVYLYRPATQNSSGTSLTGITAVATRPDSPQATGRLRWELLVPGTDYYLDPSGTWFALATPLDQNAYLAVSYLTASGGRVGTFPARDDPAGNDSLELIVEPRRGPDVPTFRYQMRQVYRIAGADLDRSSLQVSLTVNQSERPQAGAATYLAQLGLAVPSDAHVFDVDNRLFPRTRDPGAAGVIRESYIVFPNLQPFADPAKLTPAERNDSLYRTPGYLVLSQGPPAKFIFGLKYNAAVTTDRSTLMLNAFQLLPQSEQIIAAGRTLTRDVDYTINYDLGQVTFLDPDALFGNAGAVDVVARFQERGIFAIAPTSIFGLTSTYSIADVGSVNLIGIYQRQQSAFNRPPIGFEPTADFVGGLTTDLAFRGSGLTRLVSHLSPAGATAPSRLDLHGELAFTAPDPNEAGAAYLEEFEGSAGLGVSLRENAWNFGSRPQRGDGLAGVGFGAGFDSADAVMLTWQNLYYDPATGTAARVNTSDIDTSIVITGGSVVENVLYLGLHPDTSGGYPIVDSVTHQFRLRWTLPARPGRPRWRSMVTSLSQTGVDLSNAQYLEFWVFQDTAAAHRNADSAGVQLAIDLGSVNEDALAIVPESLTISPDGRDSLFRGRRYTGVGRLDTEREPTGIFNAATDDNGILQDRPDTLIVNGQILTDVPLCRRQLSSSVPLYNWGDLDVRCTNGDGTMETEDLNGDNVLNANGSADNVNRYVVDLANSPYFVRKGGAGWKLYRVPLRRPDAVIGTPDMRLVQHLRITVVAPAAAGPEFLARLALARMQFVGAPWIRRAATPIQGLSGSVGLATGSVDVGVVSTENQELGYTPPPGAVDQSNQKDAISKGLQINERSLRILATDLGPDQRAEAVGRFPSGAQNLLKYRTLRLWVRGRGPGWETGELKAVFKVGTDDRDFYGYRIGAVTTSWLPEVVISLDTWRRLRAEIEFRWLSGLPPSGSATCGGDSTAYVACDGPYIVQVGNPGISPPNLAAVQEMAAAVYNGSTTLMPTAELWVDDIRMTDPVADVGRAVVMTAHVAASDMGDVTLSFVQQDGNFQQINQDPTYQTTTSAQASTTWRLDRFLPTGLGVAAPVTFSLIHNTTDPQLLQGTDLDARDLVGLRRPASTATAWGITLRRTSQSARWWLHWLVDPLTLSGQTSSTSATALLSTSTDHAYSVSAAYNMPVRSDGFALDLDGVVDALPDWVQRSDFGKGLRRPRITPAPTSIRWSSGLNRDRALYTSFLVPVGRPADTLLIPSEALNHTWVNSAGLSWQPLEALNANIDLTSTRDLRRYADSTPIGRVAAASRESFLGMDVGVERTRTLVTSLGFTPSISSWLRPRILRSSSFVLNRYLVGRDPVQLDGDTAGRFLLPQTLNNTQAWTIGATVDLARVVARLSSDTSPVARFVRRFRGLDISRQTSLASTYDLAAFAPSLGYQLGVGGLDDFLSQQGTTAIGVTQGRTDAITTGADLPGGLNFSMTYGITARSTWSRVGAGTQRTDTRQVEWPVGTLRWTHPIQSGPLVMVSAGLSVRNTSASSFLPLAVGGSTTASTRSTSLSPDATVTFHNGFSLSLSYSSVGQSNASTGNVTETSQRTFNASLSGVFQLPTSLSRTRRQVRAMLTGVRSASTTCLVQTVGASCDNVSDQRRTEINGSLFTEVISSAEAGLSFGYLVNDVRELNQLNTNLYISLSLNIPLSSGGYR